MYNSEELGRLFFTAHPESPHELDRQRFIRWSFARAREERGFDYEGFEGSGVPARLLAEYETVYSYIRTMVEMIRQRERL